MKRIRCHFPTPTPNGIFILLTLLSITCSLFACSGTPNNISLTFVPGQCVQLSQYAGNVQSLAAATFPQIVNNPSSSPYCMAVTINNNNSGQNANNIQTTIGGLQVIYNVGAQSYNSELGDNAASNNGLGYTQTLGNFALFDPNNCATTQGSTVVTINKSGGSCTFYFQLLSNANPVGVYPITITYNYSNGNTQNLYVTANINQRVYLYAGANAGLYYESGLSATGDSSSAQWQSTNVLADDAINHLLTMTYGDILLATTNQVYTYNGISSAQVGSDLNSSINGLSLESNSQNIYAATNGGVYAYLASESTLGWQVMTDTADVLPTSSDVIAIQSFVESTAVESAITLYLATESATYSCNQANIATASMTCTSYVGESASYLPTEFFTNALAIDQAGNLYSGNLNNESFGISSALVNTISWESQYLIQPALNESSYLGFGGFYVLNTPSAGALVYYGLLANPATESGLYLCVVSTALCSPVVSTSQSQLSGNVNTITADGAGNLYVAGTNLDSIDWTGIVDSPQLSATLLLNGAAVPTSLWLPIIESAGMTNINSLTVSSMLTTY